MIQCVQDAVQSSGNKTLAAGIASGNDRKGADNERSVGDFTKIPNVYI